MNISAKQLSDKIHDKINQIIWTQDIGNKKISYCNLSKESRSGLFSNLRFFILVHGQYMGYGKTILKEDVRLPFFNLKNIPELKQIIPLKKIVRLQTLNDKGIVITFQFQGEPRQWLLHCPTPSTAHYLLQILTDQCALKKAKGPKKQTQNSKKKSQRQPIFQSNSQNNNKKNESQFNQNIKNIYAKSDQQKNIDQPKDRNKINQKYKVIQSKQKQQLKKQIHQLKSALQNEKNKQKEILPDYVRQEEKGKLIKQIEIYKYKCSQHQIFIQNMKKQYQKKLKEKDQQIFRLKNNLIEIKKKNIV